MKAKDGVLEFLDKVLTAEFTAMHQYLLHAGLCRDCGYDRLAHEFQEISREEVEHASGLIQHILYLEGTPDMQRLHAVKTGRTVPELLEASLTLEREDLKLLREAIAHCDRVGDYTTRHKLEEMSVDTDEHIEWHERQLRAIQQAGLPQYLGEQLTREEPA